MFESLTAFIPVLAADHHEEPIIDRESGETSIRPNQCPLGDYDKAVDQLENEIYRFHEEHPDFDLKHYIDILNENGLKWETKSMRQADISTLDGKAVMALLTGAVRAVRYCEGILLEFCMDGTMIKWLRRLKELDEESIV